MDPGTGRLYSADQLAAIDPEDRARLVRIEGTREQVQQVSDAVAYANRADRRRAARTARKDAARAARKGR